MQTIQERIDEMYNSDDYSLIREDIERVFTKGVEFAQRWIPIEEELPEVSGFDCHNAVNVKFIINTGETRECAATLDAVTRHCFENSPIDKRWYVYPSGGHELKTITHWRPINIT